MPFTFSVPLPLISRVSSLWIAPFASAFDSEYAVPSDTVFVVPSSMVMNAFLQRSK